MFEYQIEVRLDGSVYLMRRKLRRWLPHGRWEPRSQEWTPDGKRECYSWGAYSMQLMPVWYRPVRFDSIENAVDHLNEYLDHLHAGRLHATVAKRIPVDIENVGTFKVSGPGFRIGASGAQIISTQN